MSQLTTVRQLQQRISDMQPLRVETALPTHPQLVSLLPGGALQRGTTVSVQGSLQLALALISAVSRSGAWCGAIGVPELGAEEAHRIGIALERFVLVPTPESRTLAVTSTLSEVLTVMLVRVAHAPSSHEVERINAKLREHGSTLIVLGTWPRPTTALHAAGSHWSGVQRGWGLLDTRQLSVRSQDHRGSLKHTVRFVAGAHPLDSADSADSADSRAPS